MVTVSTQARIAPPWPIAEQLENVEEMMVRVFGTVSYILMARIAPPSYAEQLEKVEEVMVVVVIMLLCVWIAPPEPAEQLEKVEEVMVKVVTSLP